MCFSIILQTKSLLFKNPAGRYTAKQLINRDYIKAHIDKLLSFTVKPNNNRNRVNAAPSETSFVDAGKNLYN